MADSGSRQILLGVVLAGALGYGAYSMIYQPRSAEVAALQERVERLQAQNSTARQLTEQEGRSDVEQRLAVYRKQLVQVEGLIPSSEELPDLLDAISAEAQRTGVDLALIQPVGASAEEFYTRRTYELAVNGSFHQIGQFLTEIASLPRIVTPINLNVTVRNDSTAAAAEPDLQASFAIETYVLPSAGMAIAPSDSASAL